MALRRSIKHVGVLGAIPKTISMCIKSRNFCFGKIDGEEWVFETPAVRGFSAFNKFIACRIGKKLFKKYLATNGRPDVIHVHNAQAADIAIWIKKKYKIPFVVTEHSSLMWQLGNITPSYLRHLQYIYDQSSANIAVSKALADHLASTFHLPFTYIPNVVDTDFFKLNSLRERDEITRLVSIGNLTENKNHLTLVKAVHSLLRQGYPIRLEIAGSGEQREIIYSYISENGLQDRVHLSGLLSKPQVVELLGRSDFFVLPSQKETFGVVLIEAMACGLPVLAFKSGGPESIITSDRLGLLHDVQDNLEDGLLKLIGMSYDSSKIREYAKENYSYEAVAEMLIHQYSVVII